MTDNRYFYALRIVKDESGKTGVRHTSFALIDTEDPTGNYRVDQSRTKLNVKRGDTWRSSGIRVLVPVTEAMYERGKALVDELEVSLKNTSDDDIPYPFAFDDEVKEATEFETDYSFMAEDGRSPHDYPLTVIGTTCHHSARYIGQIMGIQIDDILTALDGDTPEASLPTAYAD